MMLNKKAGLPALVLLAAVMLLVFGALIGCPQEEDYTPEGVLTVNGADDGVYYEADVYDYSDAVIDAAQLNTVISTLVPTGTGLGIAGNGTLEINLKNADGTAFTSDGDFLAVLKDPENAGVSARYMASVPFTAGSATLEYADMDTALVGPIKYAVTFDLNYTDAPNPPEEQTVSEGGKVTPPADPQRTGHTFGGWYTDANGTTKWIFGTDTVKDDTTLYAKWMLIKYTVTFDTGGVTPVPAFQDVPYGDYAKSPADIKEGHTLDGWYKEAAKTTKWDFGTDTVKEDITLYGEWKLGAYKVTFDTGDAEHTPAPLENVWYESTITEPEITKTGYTLDGWYKEAARTTKWNFGTDTVKEDITLYGTWTRNTYKVTFVIYGTSYNGDAYYKAVDVPHGDKITPPTDIAPKTDCDLDGWYTTTDYAASWDFINSTVTADTTLYARWKLLTFAAVIAEMAADAGAAAKTYTMPSGNEAYSTYVPITLNSANSPVSVTIDGEGRVVTGNTVLITVGAGVTITMKNITFKKVSFSVADGGKLVLDNGAVVSGNAGAGITVSGTSATAKGTLEMKAGSSVTNNRASGVVVQTNGVFTMDGGTISGNDGFGVTISGGTLEMNAGAIVRENAGGGVTVSGESTSAIGTLVMKEGASISDNGNLSTSSCGVLLTGSGSTLIMDGGKVSGNAGRGSGAGVAVHSANSTFTMNGGEISGNNAGQRGGGVFFEARHSIFNMTGGTIRNNNAGIEGGGVCIWSTNTFNMTGGEITGNTAVGNGGGGLIESGTLTGNPQIGGTTSPGAGKGWIHGNTPNDVYPAQ